MKKIIAIMIVVLMLVCDNEGRCETERHVLECRTYHNSIILIYNEYDPDFLHEGATLWIESQDLNKEREKRTTSIISFETDYPPRILEAGLAGKGYLGAYYLIVYTEGDDYSKTTMLIFPYEYPFMINEEAMHQISLPGVTDVLKRVSYFDKCLFVFQNEAYYFPFGGAEGSVSLDLIDIEKGEISHLKDFPPDTRIFFEDISSSVYQFPAANTYFIHDVMTLTPYGFGKIYDIKNPDDPPPPNTLNSGPLVEVNSFFTEYPETNDDLKFHYNQPVRCHAYGCGWPCMDGECDWLTIRHTINTTEFPRESIEIPR